MSNPLSRPGLAWLVWALVGLVLLTCARHTVIDLDCFHEMALARMCFEVGHVPRVDVFAYTPTVPVVVHHELGHGVLLYLVAAVGGASGIMVLKYALVAAVIAAVIRHAVREGAQVPSLAWTVPLGLAMLQVGLTTVRAQLVSIVFFAALLLVLQADREGRPAALVAWVVPQIVWAWFHGGVAVGVGVLAIHAGDRTLAAWRAGTPLRALPRRVGAALGVAAIAPALLAVGPYGVHYPAYLIEAVTMPRPLIGEWQPIYAGGLSGALLLWAGSVALAAFAVWSDPQRRLFPAALLAVTAILSARSARHESLFAVAWLAYVPALLAASPAGAVLEGSWRSAPRVIAALCAVVGATGVAWAIQYRAWELRVPTVPEPGFEGAPVYPQGAIDWLRGHPQIRHVMTPFEIGAFVSWQLYPSVLVSLDSRYELAYPLGALEESVAFYRAETGWQATLDRYDTHAVLVPVAAPIASALEVPHRSERGTWRVAYRDDSFLVVAREDRHPVGPIEDRRGLTPRGRFP